MCIRDRTLLIDLNEKQVKAEVVVQKKEQAQAEAEKQAAYVVQLKEEVKELEADRQACEEQGAELRRKLNETSRHFQELQEERAQTEQKAAEILRRLNEDESRLKLLEDMREGYEGDVYKRQISKRLFPEKNLIKRAPNVKDLSLIHI